MPKIKLTEADIANIKAERKQKGLIKDPPKKDPDALAKSIEQRFKLDQPHLIELIRKHKGLITHVARKLKMPCSTLQRYVKLRPNIEDALKEAREAMGDAAEDKLFNLINQGDVRCILYYLSTVHRNRGYGLRPGDDPFGDSTRPVYVETVNVIAVPEGQFLPPKPKPVIDQ